VRGATALAEVLRVNKSLSVLRLGDNHLGGKGCGLILDALRSNPIAMVRHATRTTVSLPLYYASAATQLLRAAAQLPSCFETFMSFFLSRFKGLRPVVLPEN
jgi:hypothetical protein